MGAMRRGLLCLIPFALKGAMRARANSLHACHARDRSCDKIIMLFCNIIIKTLCKIKQDTNILRKYFISEILLDNTS